MCSKCNDVGSCLRYLIEVNIWLLHQTVGCRFQPEPFLSLQALDVNKKLNCCTGVLLESFDQLKTLVSHKEGLLYGVPVSIKENIGYKVSFNCIRPHCRLAITLTRCSDMYAYGSCLLYIFNMLFPLVFIIQHQNYDSSCGVVINLDRPAQEDSVLVQVLKKQGAIPFVKTNLPQVLLRSFNFSFTMITQFSHFHILCNTSELMRMYFSNIKSICAFFRGQKAIMCITSLSFPVMIVVTPSMGKLSIPTTPRRRLAAPPVGRRLLSGEEVPPLVSAVI